MPLPLIRSPRRAAVILAASLLLPACRNPQSISVTFDARKNLVEKVESTTPKSNISTDVRHGSNNVDLPMGTGDKVSITIDRLSPGDVVRYRRISENGPQRLTDLPDGWRTTPKTATPSVDPKQAEQEVNAVRSGAQLPPLEAPIQESTIPTTPATAPKAEAPVQGPAERPDDQKKPADDPAFQVTLRREIGSLFRAAKVAEEQALNSTEAYALLGRVLQLAHGLSDQGQQRKWTEEAKSWREKLLDGGKAEDLPARDQARKAVTELLASLQANEVAVLADRLAIAEKAVAGLRPGRAKDTLDNTLLRLRQGLQGQSFTAVLPQQVYADKDFTMEIRVGPKGEVVPGEGEGLSRGFYLSAFRDRDWEVYPSTGLALSTLVDEEWAIKQGASSTPKALIRQPMDKARGEVLAFLHFQNKGATGRKWPWLLSLGIGTTGSDLRYYLGSGVSLGRIGVLSFGAVGGRAMRLKDGIDLDNYLGTDPSGDRRSAFNFGYFLSLTARLGN